jgi:cytoskeletal protein RodZ
MYADEIKRDIGETLKAQRAKKDLSLEEVQAAIKVNKRFIKAMEDNEFSKIPTYVAAKGFLKNYAIFLGLDSRELLSELAEKFPPEKTSNPKLVVPVRTDFKLPDLFSNLAAQKRRVILICVLLALIAIYFGGQLIFRMVERRENPRTSAVPLAVPVNRALSLEVTAVDKAWVLIKADGDLITDEVLSIGDTRVWAANDHLLIKTGNAGGIRIKFNGKNIGILGEENAVVEREFTK